jgi:hypothetical protein
MLRMLALPGGGHIRKSSGRALHDRFISKSGPNLLGSGLPVGAKTDVICSAE